jgi:hypothetical protein
MSTDPNDFLFASGAKSASFEAVGDAIKGVIVSAEVAQQTDPKTGESKTWSDGRPVMQMIVTLQTDLREDDGDDGIRRLYCKGGNFEVASGKGTALLPAIRDAIKKAGGSQIQTGANLTVQHSGLGVQKNRAFNAPKPYVAKYETSAAPAIDIDDI